jgi:hypothetical protein
LAALALAPPAHADTTAEDRASADALYEDAGRLMKEGKFADACPKLEASQKLDPGVGTLLRLGYCLGFEGKVASAWATFNECVAMARKANDRRADDAANQAKLLELKLARLRLDVAPENRSAAIQVLRDGKPIDPAAWDTPAPVDPGTHTITAEEPGKRRWQTTVVIEAKPGVISVAIPALEDAPADPGAAPLPNAPAWGAQRYAGVAVGGVGVAGVVIGAIFGALTMKKLGDAKSQGHCDQDWATCDATGFQMRQDAMGTAHGSTATFVIGGVALATGILVFATAPSGSSTPAAKTAVRVIVGPVAAAGMSGMLVRGGW